MSPGMSIILKIKIKDENYAQLKIITTSIQKTTSFYRLLTIKDVIPV